MISDKLANPVRSEPRDTTLPDFLMVIGDSREDECVFEWAQKLGKKDVRDVVTVQLRRMSTTASTTLTQGVTGKQKISINQSGSTNKLLLGVLSTLQKLATL